MDLQGIWRFELDENDVGMEEKWYCRELRDRIHISGTLQAQGYGHEIDADTPLVDGLHDRLWFLREEARDFIYDGQTLIPFLAQPARHYMGAAWYQRDVEIPDGWEEKQLALFMELVRWRSTVWIDDVCMGDFTSLCVPHRYRLGNLSPGVHSLTVRVDNRMLYHYRPDAHGVSDSVGHTWNGIAGRVELTAKNTVSLERIAVYPDYRSKTALVKVRIANEGERMKGRISVCRSRAGAMDQGVLGRSAGNTENDAAGGFGTEKDNDCPDNNCLDNDCPDDFYLDIENGGTEAEYSVFLGEEAQCWDEFTPCLQRMRLVLSREDGRILDEEQVVFGLRNIAVDGRKFLLNGRVISFRGTHDGGCFPLTGYPAPDTESWRRIFAVCRDWGMNHVRFHSWCPPEAAFQAADEAGIYLQIETGMWNYFIEGGEIEEQLFLETDRILDAFGNHPSFVMLSSGNEPHGSYKPVAARWVEKYRREDGRRLYCAQSGWLWPYLPEELHMTDYLYTCSRYNTSKMRGREGWFGKDYRQYLEDIEAPFICHELGQYCAYPDFSLAEKFTGYLTSGSYRCYQRIAERHGLLERNSEFVEASGILQFLAYKEEIEANLRTPGFSGFSLLDLHDYLGQGGALVGLLDAFWEPKPYADAREFRRFCSPVTALARISKYTFRTGEKLCAGIEIACYEREDISHAYVYWQVADDSGKIYFRGDFGEMLIRTGGNTDVGKLELPLEGLPAPGSYFLAVGIMENAPGGGSQAVGNMENAFGGGSRAAENMENAPGGGSRITENRWKIWVYPEQADCTVPEGVRVTRTLGETMEALREGGKVLFLPRPEDIHYNSPMLSSLPVFWNGRMGPKWCRSLGMWCDTGHGALREFPTKSGMEWQWSEIVEGARGMNVEGLPSELRPFLCPIDDWNRGYRLALAFECKMCGGRLLVCSADLFGNLRQRPAARQLLHSFLKYMDSDGFAPEVSVTERQLKTFLADTAIMRRLEAKVRLVESGGLEQNMAQKGVSDEKGAAMGAKYPAENLLDGDPGTYWLAGKRYGGGHYPFTLEFETAETVCLRGLLIMPRQNHRDWEGQVRTYEVLTEQNGQWVKLCGGEMAASPDPKEILFSAEVSLRRLRLKLLEGYGAKNLSYWDKRAETGFCLIQEDYADECVSLAEVDFLCSGAAAGGDVHVEYHESATASEEIY